MRTPSLTLPRNTGGGNRYAPFFIVLFALCIASSATSAFADDSPTEIDQSISRGLTFLATQQNADGSFAASQKPAMTGLALGAYLSAGHTADVGQYGGVVRRAISYLLSAARPDGTFGPSDRPMYDQAIATLALAEAYGVEPNEEQRRRIAALLSKSVQIIVNAQNVRKSADFTGGWGTAANSADSDLPLTGWNSMALRALLDCGFEVPKTSVSRSLQFVMRCEEPAIKGFGYQPHQAANPNCTGVAAICLLLLDPRDESHRKTANQAAQYLMTHRVEEGSQYMYYGFFCTNLAIFENGDPSLSAISNATSARLLKLQQPDGGWPQTSEGPGRAYTTSMSLLTLTISYKMLPLYQR